MLLFSHEVMVDSWNPMDYSQLDSNVYGISQARILEWVDIFISKGSSQTMDWTHVPCIVGWVLYCWVTWEVQNEYEGLSKVMGLSI